MEWVGFWGVYKNAVGLQSRMSATLVANEGEPTRRVRALTIQMRGNHKASLVIERTNPEIPGYMQP